MTPILAILGCLWIIKDLRPVTLLVFVVWTAVVLVWYFTYGLKHSHLGRHEQVGLVTIRRLPVDDDPGKGLSPCMRSTRQPSRWCAASWRTPRTGCGWTRCRWTRAPSRPRISTACWTGSSGTGPVADEVLGVYSSVIAPSIISADSPRFLGFIPAAPTKASLLFDMLVSCASIQGISWLEASGAIAAENTVLRLIADEAGLPAGAGGCFVSGGSAGNLSALAVARETAKKRLGDAADRSPAAGRGRHRRALLDREHPAAAGDGRPGRGHPRPPADGRGRPRGHRRRPGRHRRRRGGLHVRAPPTPASSTTWPGSARSPGSAAGGSTSTAPTAGPASSRRSLRPKYDGIELADSFILDPHKWLFTPFDCCALLYRDPELARATHTQDASYLDVIHTADGEWNPTDYAYHLTRRARGLPLWFSLAVYGVDAYREAIEIAVDAGPGDRRR